MVSSLNTIFVALSIIYSTSHSEQIHCPFVAGEATCRCNSTISGEPCTLNCTTVDHACLGDFLICRDNDDCIIDCAQNRGCQAAHIICPANARCLIYCDSKYQNNCLNAVITLNNASNYTCIGYCDRFATYAPTLPTRDPTTAIPTQPTTHPTTSQPTPSTNNPTTYAPSNSPVTSDPTTATPTWFPTTSTPTSSPNTANPTNSPVTSDPTTAAPTWSPTTDTVTPTTADPTTSNPSTSFPTTQSPTTNAPTTASPTTIPTTSNPTTTMPTTSDPTTNTPTTSSPTTSDPTPSATNILTTYDTETLEQKETSHEESNSSLLLYILISIGLICFCVGMILYFLYKRKIKRIISKNVQSAEHNDHIKNAANSDINGISIIQLNSLSSNDKEASVENDDFSIATKDDNTVGKLEGKCESKEDINQKYSAAVKNDDDIVVAMNNNTTPEQMVANPFNVTRMQPVNSVSTIEDMPNNDIDVDALDIDTGEELKNNDIDVDDLDIDTGEELRNNRLSIPGLPKVVETNGATNEDVKDGENDIIVEGIEYDIDEGGAKEVSIWLKSINFIQYYDIFVRNGFDKMELVKQIDDKNDLKDIGITLKAHQIAIMNYINKLK